MTNQTKILIGLVAVIAFTVGITLNASKSGPAIDSSGLLSAQVQQDPNLSEENKEPSFTSIEESLGQLTLVNFWASWCAPCRDEMPMFETMYRQNNKRGFMVIGITIDSPDRAQPMLDSMDISYPIFYAEQSGSDIMTTLGNPQGLLPYSVLLNSDGEVIDQVLGKINEQQIFSWISDNL